MLFKKDEKNLSVEIIDIKLDTSDVPSIKEARLVHIDGKAKLVKDMGKYDDNYTSPYQIKLNDIPIVQAKIPECSTCCSVLATGYGIENTNCKELLDIQEKVNSNYVSLEKSIENIEPLLTLLETGFYLVADAICYPTDGDKNFFWNVPNEEIETLATGPAAIYDDEDAYFNYIYGEPVYLYPTQTTDSYDENRVKYYIDKFKELSDSSPRAIVYYLDNLMNFVIDGHHKACASALLGEPLRCLLIIPGVVARYPNEIKIFFSSSIIINKKDIPYNYSSFVKYEFPSLSSKEIIIKDGNVNKRKWEKKYLDSAKKYLTQKEYARMIDILINNAGISYIGLLQDMSILEWNNIINTNLTSAFLMSKYVIPYMLKKQNGHIINISSVWGNIGASMEVAYSASKGGLNTFTKALAKELAPSNILVNTISPGFIDTEMNKNFEKEELEAIFEEIPLGRAGKTSEVADLVYKIATSKYLTGQIITIDGGWT